MAEFVLGNFANCFIALVNCIDWVKKKKFSSVDGILTALAVSRIVLLWMILMYWDLTTFNPVSYGTQVRIAVQVVWLVAHHFSIWFATILSLFYLLKVANFSNVIFLHLKKNINSVILVVLLGSLLLLLCYFARIYMSDHPWVSEFEGNMAWKTNLTDIEQVLKLSMVTVANLIPFITSLICFLLLIYSQCKHIRKMQFHGKRSQDPSTKVHVKAVQTVLSFLLLFAFYFLVVTISIWYFKGQHSRLLLLLSHAFISSFPSIHSFVLIWGNRKLNRAFLLIWQWVRRWLKKWNPLTP
ncbi:taste receptor type 2 member 19-like [Lepus europaeus]|uniref:taste receptor type 2 member 19-like n=1 Tax=Lepus europaeus TaxID=9983 RepID=UPI002B46B7D0|nr:taste receptor type 2 member 19-like [Lepus europaeus]